MESSQKVYELGKQYTPHRSSLHVIELPAARFDQWRHAGKPLAKLRQGEDLGYTTLPLGQTVHGGLRDDGVERATGIREDAIPILRGPMLSGLFEQCHQFASLAIFGLEDITYKYHAFTSFHLKYKRFQPSALLHQTLSVCAPLTMASTMVAAPTIWAPSIRCSCVMPRGLVQDPQAKTRPPLERNFCTNSPSGANPSAWSPSV